MTALSIDERAEREAAAIERMHDLADVPLPLPRLQYLRELTQMAAELGITPPPRKIYPRRLIIRHWLRVVESFQRGVTPPASCFPRSRPERTEIGTRRRCQKADRLRVLEGGALPEAVTIQQAVDLLGVSRGGLEKRLYSGVLPRQRTTDGRVLIRMADLIRFQRDRLAAPRRTPSKAAA